MPSCRPLMPSFVSIVLALSAVDGLAQSASGTHGYSDNICTLTSAIPSFQKDAAGKVAFVEGYNQPQLLIDYNWSCPDGAVFTTKVNRTFKNLIANVNYQLPHLSVGKPQPAVSYKPNTHTLVFTGTFVSDGAGSPKEYTETWWQTTGWDYWRGLANSKAPAGNIQTWTQESEAATALAQQPRYIPANQVVVQPYRKFYPAFPIQWDRDDVAAQLPRPVARIDAKGFIGTLVGGKTPQYFATVYCFPGRGDNELFNRPVVVSDAFDPTNGRSALSIYNEKKTAALLARDGANSPRNAGYDMIFVDFSQGGGNILINAALFLKAVEWVHSRTPNNIIVGGPSMGGIVPRLAMLYSIPENNEANGPGVTGKDLAPRVKGYLSIDSPHKGATISGSLQEALHSISLDGNVTALLSLGHTLGMDQPNTAKQVWEQQLSVPAAHQMLYEHWYAGVKQRKTTSHDQFYNYLKALGNGKALGDPRGYRKDMTLVSLAYSNFHKPIPGVSRTTYQQRGHISVQVAGVTQAYRSFSAGGAANSPNWQELAPGSTGDWYWSPYDRGSEKFFDSYAVTSDGKVLKSWNPDCRNATFFNSATGRSQCQYDATLTLAHHQSAEKYAGTFIPIASALDLDGFDVMNPPTLLEESIRHYSPFDAVYYMRSAYNDYNRFRSVGTSTETPNDKRYEHIVFDPQLMRKLMDGLQFIEEAPSRKVSFLMPYQVGAGIMPLTGAAGWTSLPAAKPNPDVAGGFLHANFAAPSLPAFLQDGTTRLYKGAFGGGFYGGLYATSIETYGQDFTATFGDWDQVSVAVRDRNNVRRKIHLNDFTGDFLDDVLSLGGYHDAQLYVGVADGSGGFTNKLQADIGFVTAMQQPEVSIATGDFNEDWMNDIVLVGGLGWTKAKLAIGRGDGTFTFKEISATEINAASWKKGAIFLAGNFRFMNSHDIAVISGNTLTITGFTSSGTSVTEVKSLITPQGWPFWSWAQNPKAKVVVADFNFDGLSDIALTGVPGWTTIPVAFSQGSGPLRFTNAQVPDFAGLAGSSSRVRVMPMEVNYDYRADLVLTGGPGWTTIPVAMSKGDGTFTVTNVSNPEFASWSANHGIKPLAYPADLKK